MTRVLMVGLEPEAVDFTDPALPPGLTAEMIRLAIQMAERDVEGRGWRPESFLIRPDETAIPTLERKLAEGPYDCVVIGAGLRLPPRNLVLFEQVINAVHQGAPGVPIAFNTRPQDSGDAAARWVR